VAPICCQVNKGDTFSLFIIRFLEEEMGRIIGSLLSAPLLIIFATPS